MSDTMEMTWVDEEPVEFEIFEELLYSLEGQLNAKDEGCMIAESEHGAILKVFFVDEIMFMHFIFKDDNSIGFIRLAEL